MIVEGSVNSELKKLETSINSSDKAEEFLFYHQKKKLGITGPILILSVEYTIDSNEAETYITESIRKAGYISLEDLKLNTEESTEDRLQKTQDKSKEKNNIYSFISKNNSKIISESIIDKKYPKKMNWWIAYSVLLTYVVKIVISLVLISNDISVVANSNPVGPMLIRGAIAGGIINNSIKKGDGIQYAKFENVLILVSIIFILQVALGAALELTIY